MKKGSYMYIYIGYLIFSVNDRNLFHRVDTIGNIFTSGAATSENITMVFCLFIAFNPFWKELYQNPVPLPHSNALQYYVKREKFKVNDVILPSGCEARTINLGNKNMKIGIFTGVTSVRSKNIFTDISRYPTGKHEIIYIQSFDNLHNLRCLLVWAHSLIGTKLSL